MTLTLEALAEKTLTGELKTFKELHETIDKTYQYKGGKKDIKGLSKRMKQDLKKLGSDTAFELKKETLANSFSVYLELIQRPTTKVDNQLAKEKVEMKEVVEVKTIEKVEASTEKEVVKEVDTNTNTNTSMDMLANETLTSMWFTEKAADKEKVFSEAMARYSIVFRKNKSMEDVQTFVARAWKKNVADEEARKFLLVGYLDKVLRVSKKQL